MVAQEHGMTSAHDVLLQIIENTPDGVFAVDSSHRIILWNAGAQRILGYAPSEAVGRYCYEVFAGHDVGGNLVCRAACSDMALAQQGSLIPTRDFGTRTKHSDEIWVNVTNIPVPSAIPGLSSVVHILREISSRGDMEQLVERLSSVVERLHRLELEQPTVTQEAPPRNDTLTPREQEVLRHLVEGRGATSIAEALVISPGTARKHVQNILRKLQVNTALEAVAYCFRHNLLKGPSQWVAPRP